MKWHLAFKQSTLLRMTLLSIIFSLLMRQTWHVRQLQTRTERSLLKLNTSIQRYNNKLTLHGSTEQLNKRLAKHNIVPLKHTGTCNQYKLGSPIQIENTLKELQLYYRPYSSITVDIYNQRLSICFKHKS